MRCLRRYILGIVKNSPYRAKMHIRRACGPHLRILTALPDCVDSLSLSYSASRLGVWWARSDSNRHGFPRGILSALCIPISPLARCRHFWDLDNQLLTVREETFFS